MAETYLQWLTAKNLRTAADTRGRLEKHFLPKFGDRLVSGLTKSDLDGWLASMAVESDDPERVRRSKDTLESAALSRRTREADIADRHGGRRIW